MSADEILTLLATFPNLDTTDIAAGTDTNVATANFALSRLLKSGEVDRVIGTKHIIKNNQICGFRRCSFWTLIRKKH